MSEHVIVTDEAGIRTIRMNRPEKKNALTLAMYEAMTDALESANTDDAVRCVLIAGIEGAFTAGNDLADFLAAATGDGGFNRAALRFLPALVNCRKPMVACVSGVAVGIGTTMLLHCDFVVAATDATFSTPFVGLGLVPEAGSTLLVAASDGPAPRVRVSGHGPPAQCNPCQGRSASSTWWSIRRTSTPRRSGPRARSRRCRPGRSLRHAR